MPTARGWIIAGAGIALWVTGVLLGTEALQQLGFGFGALVVAAVLVLRFTRHDLRVSRAVSSPQVVAGQDVTIAIKLDNLGDAKTPTLVIEDRVPADLGSGARFVIDGLRPGGQETVGSDLRPRRRGRWEIGPASLALRDPFGVAKLKIPSEEVSTILVFPAIERLLLPVLPENRRTQARSARRQLTGARGEEFYTLREYVEGDDLRRVHWPATAKRNRFMVRQDETPWQARATVILDDRRISRTRRAWETSVGCAASISDLFIRSGYSFTLAPVHEAPIGPAKGSHHLKSCLEKLATIEPARSEGSATLATRLASFGGNASGEDVLILIAGDLDPEMAEAAVYAASRCRAAAIISVGEGPPDPNLAALQAAGVRVLRLDPRSRLGSAWDAMWGRGSGAPSPVEGPRGGDAWAPKHAPA